MEIEKNTSHSFIHSTTAERTALYTSYTAGIGSAACIYIYRFISKYTPQLNIESMHYDEIILRKYVTLSKGMYVN